VQVLGTLVEIRPAIDDVAQHRLFHLVELRARRQRKDRQRVRLRDAPRLG